jgi:signal transduction histidine kinase
MASTQARNPVNQLFEGLDDKIAKDFTKSLRKVKYKKGELILMENEEGRCLYLILGGTVEIGKELDSQQTPNVQLTVMHKGDFFGEMGLLNDQPRSATAMALEDVELLEIPKDNFINLCFSHPIVMLNLIRTLSGRLRDTNVKFTGLMGEMIQKNRLMAIGMTASKIIHDIKTPLTVITLTAQLIESLFPDSVEFTQSIIKQTKLVDELVRETMDYVKGTPNSLFQHQIEMSQFLEDIKETYGASLKGRNIELRIDNRCHKMVHFDEDRIRRVIINLVRNSSEAMEDEGLIEIVATLSANWLQISVIDNGPGIPEAIANELFKPFVTYNKPNGTGLGLPICQKLVQEHNGRIEFSPIEPHGSRFDVRLPQNLD